MIESRAHLSRVNVIGYRAKKKKKKQVQISRKLPIIEGFGVFDDVRGCDTRDNYIAQAILLDSKRCAHDWLRRRSVFTMTGNVTARIFWILAKGK